MIVSIEQKHIDAGEIYSAYECPIALAVRDQYPDFQSVTVTPDDLYIGISLKHGTSEMFDMPDEASAFVRDFDKGKAVQPFTFEAKKLW